MWTGWTPKTAQKVDFYSRQFMDAMSPTNFLMTNPEVLRKTAETGGENLLKGLNNLLGDLERGKGQLRIKMTDTDAFKLGGNIGVTPGKVVFQNELMQLIQYTPTTEKVLKRPLLIVPPWINKFYILDLRPKNSFIRWAVSQGHTVFVISWVNPDETMAERGFEDYMKEGFLAALDAIELATGEREVNAIGYCLGGTLLACSLAYMAAKDDDRVKTATFFVTMLDFQEAGELGVFIDEEQLRALEDKMAKRGYLEGSEMATTFNMLRANDLIWSFVVNNYLMGNDPFPFDLLYWNADFDPDAGEDAQLLPAQDVPGESAEGAGRRSSWTGCRSIWGRSRRRRIFSRRGRIISRRGNRPIAGLSCWAARSGSCWRRRGISRAWSIRRRAANTATGSARSLPADADAWLAGATEMAGSWWPDWQRWILSHGKAQVPARVPGDGKLTVIEDAPGSYVQVRLT